jgi:hypothetical protein
MQAHRSGPISEQQREFIHRVQFSVSNITMLINDLSTSATSSWL